MVSPLLAVDCTISFFKCQTSLKKLLKLDGWQYELTILRFLPRHKLGSFCQLQHLQKLEHIEIQDP